MKTTHAGPLITVPIQFTFVNFVSEFEVRRLFLELFSAHLHIMFIYKTLIYVYNVCRILLFNYQQHCYQTTIICIYTLFQSCMIHYLLLLHVYILLSVFHLVSGMVPRYHCKDYVRKKKIY